MPGTTSPSPLLHVTGNKRTLISRHLHVAYDAAKKLLTLLSSCAMPKVVEIHECPHVHGSLPALSYDNSLDYTAPPQRPRPSNMISHCLPRLLVTANPSSHDIIRCIRVLIIRS